ncbi:MAG: GatB/YqeY domain-containing protein [Thermodesulfovibrionia bacterium]
MSILERIEGEFKSALKSRDERRVSILRMVKASIKNREIEKSGPLSEDDIYDILNSFVKKGRESIEQFSRAGRSDLLQKEEEELRIIRSFLPEQLSEDEIRRLIKEAIDEVNAKGAGDVGKVMRALMPRVKGRADGRLVNNLVKEILEG